MPDRKFTTWQWWRDESLGKRHEFEVRMKWPDNVAQQNDKPTFYIENVDPPISISSGDLTALRDQLDAVLKEFYAITWEPWLAVSIDKSYSTGTNFHSDSPDKLLSRAFAITVAAWDQGTRRDGTRLYRTKSNKNESGARMYRGEFTNHFDGSSHERGRDAKSIGLIRDTPENRAALTAINAALGGVIDRLAAFLGREGIEATVRNVIEQGAGLLLTDGAEATK